MHFIFSATAQLNSENLNERFFPFDTGSILPKCEIFLYEKADGKVRFADSAFLRFINESYPKTTVHTGDYSFAPCGNGVAIWDELCAAAWVHNNYQTIDISVHYPEIYPPILAQVIMQAYRYSLLFAGGLLVHSASIIYNNKAILFCGIPGAGKSTQARLWNNIMSAPSLNNDQTAVLWDHDTMIAHGTPWSGKEPCYKNEGYPLGAIVFVEKSPVDRVERLSVAEAYSLLYINNFIVPVQDGIEERYSDTVEKIVGGVPVYRQYCTMTEEAPKTLLKALRFD